jgi:hypothetical protein
MASYVPPGGKLVDEHAREERDGGLLGGKPAEASLLRTFSVGDSGAEADAAVDAAAAAASDAGWTLDAPVAGLGDSGGKPGMTISVSLQPGAAPPRLTVALTHERG